MTEDKTSFPINLTKDEVQTLLHALFECRILNTHTAQEQDLKPLSDKLKLRLEQRKKELENLKELMEGPDLQVGI
jgi:hypothetical protein